MLKYSFFTHCKDFFAQSSSLLLSSHWFNVFFFCLFFHYHTLAMAAHMKLSDCCLKHITPALPPSPYSGPLTMTSYCKHLDLLRSLLFNTSLAWYFFYCMRRERDPVSNSHTHATATHNTQHTHISTSSSAGLTSHSQSSCSFSSQFLWCSFLPQRKCCVRGYQSICVSVWSSRCRWWRWEEFLLPDLFS